MAGVPKMKLFLGLVAAAAFSGLATADTTPKYNQSDIDSGKILQQLSKTAYDAAWARLPASGSGCTKESVRIRKEWRTMPDQERIAYTNAVQCLMQKPSQFTNIDGAKSAFDDFGVLHFQATPYVHFSATFLLWHRYYIWIFEEQLRNKCSYTGRFPYWEWGLDAGDMDKSPLFDGTPTSLGGNGAPVTKGHSSVGFGTKPGTGGGCVTAGPFANYTVNLGPSSLADPLKYNPRCLKRDLNTAICARWASLRNTTDAIVDSPDIEIFQAVLQGDGRYPESYDLGMAVHGGGHFAISGDPGGDFFLSPLEPGFWLHHGQMDRLYFIWQNQDWSNRQNISGTWTMYNQPPSDDAKLTDQMNMAPLAPNATLGSLIDTAGNTPLCYIYE